MQLFFYDYETFGVDKTTAPVIALSTLMVSLDELKEGSLSFQEMVEKTKFYKFNVTEQIKKYNKRIEKSTLDFWRGLGAGYEYIYKPLKDDLSYDQIPKILETESKDADFIITRGNNFDPRITETVYRDFDLPGVNDEYTFHGFWKLRDSRSIIDGLLEFNTSIKNTFVPDFLSKIFIAHDPCHDVAMDAYRIQYLLCDKDDDELRDKESYNDSIPF